MIIAFLKDPFQCRRPDILVFYLYNQLMQLVAMNLCYQLVRWFLSVCPQKKQYCGKQSIIKVKHFDFWNKTQKGQN